jgi:hypothetical protein
MGRAWSGCGRRRAALYAPGRMTGRRTADCALGVVTRSGRWTAIHRAGVMLRSGRWTAIHRAGVMLRSGWRAAIHRAGVMLRSGRRTAIHGAGVITRSGRRTAIDRTTWRRGPVVRVFRSPVVVVATTLMVVPVATLIDRTPADHHIAGRHVEEAGTRWRPIAANPGPIVAHPVPIARDPSVARARRWRRVLHRRRRWLPSHVHLHLGFHVGWGRRRGRCLIAWPHRTGLLHGDRYTPDTSQTGENEYPGCDALHAVLHIFDLRS